MQLKLTCLLFFVLALCAHTTSALPAAMPVDLGLTERDIETVSFADHLSGELAKRAIFPLPVNAQLANKIMLGIKGQVSTDISAKISASVSNSASTSLDIKVKLFGGIITLGDAKLHAIQTFAAKQIEGKITASIDASLENDVYGSLQVDLNNLLKGLNALSQNDLLNILIELEKTLNAKLKVELPTIVTNLKPTIKNSVNGVIKDLKFAIPFLFSITINSTFQIDVAVKACIDLAVKITAELDATASAKALL
ncbi:hypothetical protein BC941DRAFT_380802, partial [Chlamydoabsidia padenii]